ncbi:hypothetical protein [Entomobacter blattae]|uniref:hypothetical protein n=1 Tax=Entomobacter blattae TaxID=2762277 RepID=UPI00193BE3F1|nr:hypothetical protein [Entomobacter blattae]
MPFRAQPLNTGFKGKLQGRIPTEYYPKELPQGSIILLQELVDIQPFSPRSTKTCYIIDLLHHWALDFRPFAASSPR